MSDFEDREAAVTIGGLVVFVFGIPLLIGAASLFVAAWLWVLGVSGGHHMVFGWLSQETHDKAGHPHWSPGRIVPIYYLGLVSLYLLYQLGELTYAVFGAFRKSLSSTAGFH